jgi:sulfite reductase (NADPH) flavoprotein alpha-component
MALHKLTALTSPLSELQLSKLQHAMSDLTSVQTAWLSGYLAALCHTPMTALIDVDLVKA